MILEVDFSEDLVDSWRNLEKEWIVFKIPVNGF
jgi:hypothetical protein